MLVQEMLSYKKEPWSSRALLNLCNGQPRPLYAEGALHPELTKLGDVGDVCQVITHLPPPKRVLLSKA